MISGMISGNGCRVGSVFNSIMHFRVIIYNIDDTMSVSVSDGASICGFRSVLPTAKGDNKFDSYYI